MLGLTAQRGNDAIAGDLRKFIQKARREAFYEWCSGNAETSSAIEQMADSLEKLLSKHSEAPVSGLFRGGVVNGMSPAWRMPAWDKNIF